MEKNGFLSLPLCRDCEAERAEFSTKDSVTAERCYPGNALCCGEGERWKVGYAVLYTLFMGKCETGLKGAFQHDWSFFHPFVHPWMDKGI